MLQQTLNRPVLLVDDEQQLLKVSRLTLISSGIKEVATINDSRELLPYLAGQDVSAIVLDLYMPNLGGLELLPLIVRDYPHIPVIVMTALDETDTAVKCMKSGAFDYLVKPVESDRLVTSVHKALEHTSLRQE